MRPIDADAMKTKFENKKSTIQNRIMGGQMDSIAIAFYEIFIEAIDKQTTVDAVPVVHGEWHEENRRPRSAQFVCSVCHRTAYDIQPTRNKAWTKRCRYAYCPNCGCRMDGETEYVSTYSLGKISVPNGAIKQIIEDGKEQTDE